VRPGRRRSADKLLPTILLFVGGSGQAVSKLDLAPRRAKRVSKPDFAPRKGARPIAGGERSEPPELEEGEKSPGRGETILSFAPQIQSSLFIRIDTRGDFA